MSLHSLLSTVLSELLGMQDAEGSRVANAHKHGEEQPQVLAPGPRSASGGGSGLRAGGPGVPVRAQQGGGR